MKMTRRCWKLFSDKAKESGTTSVSPEVPETSKSEEVDGSSSTHIEGRSDKIEDQFTSDQVPTFGAESSELGVETLQVGRRRKGHGINAYSASSSSGQKNPDYSPRKAVKTSVVS
ncbi:hypothetical protein HAX54_031742 [Datura stramonium]|uniref:Uncharacterized protein n=1 Tax=Datura stramonium TaxID=4076 RepID=A0ABS8SC39_DATST|nr:hypothetical protein [Datura stramonium]